MARDDNTRLRITPWPALHLPLPPNERSLRTFFDPDIQAFLPDWDAALEPVTVEPGETYLKLAALDLDDTDAMARFLTLHGQLGVRGQFTRQSFGWSAFADPDEEAAAELDASLAPLIDARDKPWALGADTL